MNFFDTDVQELKYNVLKEVAKLAYNDDLTPQKLLDIAEIIVPDGEAKMRCCIYKERAIVNERVKLALGGDRTTTNMVEVLKIACDECPIDGIQITPSCRGCIAHRCQNACPKDAIRIVDRKAVIDKSKCIECGKCLAACPYSAIVKNVRPCVKACVPKAISINKENHKAIISEEKCISCGACVYQCPFGAIVDKSFITDAIKILRDSENNTKYKVYAVIAPSLASQYSSINEITMGKVISAIKELGFHAVVEAAQGADVTAFLEAKELSEKGFLTSSCCPAFVGYIEKHFPKLKENVSHNLSPMAQISKIIKENDPDAKTVFIGPCISKKGETRKESVAPYVDCTITFEEMQAMFDAKNIDIASLNETSLETSSYFGRIFAHCGGLSEAVNQALKEHGIKEEDFKCEPVSCNGINDCKTVLLKASKGLLKENFIEGMICNGGCIGGPACLSHSAKDYNLVKQYGMEAKDKTISTSISALNSKDLDNM
ncbi:MAG: 4Fe-4S dicluster domain-containing protein [Clostridia bacterium]|nr:4Fe-4S dicluster domain-containing protein [Oscillospiraceae bacterium]MBR4892405.1 4Fe-4S dicluster domain-containing protein [Clostridia bacterium]